MILLLAIGAVFRLDRTQKPGAFPEYLYRRELLDYVQPQVWDEPALRQHVGHAAARARAIGQIVALFGPSARYRALLITIGVTALCAFEFRQYLILCVQYPLYELVTEGLLRALHILKSP